MIEELNYTAATPVCELPFPPSLERYDQATQVLLGEWLAEPTDVTAVYQVGQVAAPGISDLDFIVVCKEKRRLDWGRFDPAKYPPWIQEVFTHAPYCCTEDQWKRLHGWFPVFNLRHIGGRQLEPTVMSAEHRSGCALGMLVDYLMVKMPADVLWLGSERPVRVRTLLCILHSFKYTVRLSEAAGISVLASDQAVVRDVESLRIDWHRLEEVEKWNRLSQASQRTLTAALELTARVDTELRARLSDRTRLAQRAPNPASWLTFDTEWTPQRVLRSSMDARRSGKGLLWRIPASFQAVLSTYAATSWRMAGYLRRCGCDIAVEWRPGAWQPGLDYHARAMVGYGQASRRIGVPGQQYVALGYVQRSWNAVLRTWVRRLPLVPRLARTVRARRRGTALPVNT